MTNVVSMGRTCDYLVSRAVRHRLAGRYDEAMVLLTKARTQFGLQEEIELESARVYDEIGCEEEAARSYLRVVRFEGIHKGEALFSLALSSAQRADTARAVSYFEHFTASDRHGVSDEMAALLGRQLLEEMEQPIARNRKKRARQLERKAAQLMQMGKTTAAKRAVSHALALHPTAQNHTLYTCCCLLRNEVNEAVNSAWKAHDLAPSRVQTICVLADALMAAGDMNQSRKMTYMAAMRAQSKDDLLAAAIECAKSCEDHLTIRLTGRLLRREPFHVRAMLLRACALANLGRIKQASRLFGRLCGLLPQDTICEYYYRQTKEGVQLKERLALGMDVPGEEGIARAKELLSMLYCDPHEIDADADRLYGAVRLCNWAMHSPMAGTQMKTIALILLGTLDAREAREALLDLLTEADIADSTKLTILQMLTAKEGFSPFLADIDGRLVRLAAGGVSQQPIHSREANSRVVQRASDMLIKRFPDAPQKMLELYLEYLKEFESPSEKEESCLSAAIEYQYHAMAGHSVKIRTIAKRYGVSRRLCALYARRLMKQKNCTTD